MPGKVARGPRPARRQYGKRRSEFRLLGSARVTRLSLERADGALTLVLPAQAEEAMAEVELRFVDVRDLQFRGERTELTERVVLLAEDISARGLEAAKFVVWDYEKEFIRFMCREIVPVQAA